MKEVLRHISDQKRTYSRLPLFEWMRDESLEPRERLAFYPCMAYFTMAFGDLNKFVLREEPTADAYQEMVNVRTREDDHHWPSYLEDFTELGFDAEIRATDWMRFLWGEETKQNRILAARLTTLVKGTTGVERRVVIEAIEETGNVLFNAILPLARAIEQETGIELSYCGSSHFGLEARERGHAVGDLAWLSLGPSERGRCLALADDVFSLFTAWTHELLQYALAHPRPVDVYRPREVPSAVWRRPLLKSG